MRILKKIIIGFILLVVIVYLGAVFFLRAYGVVFISGKLSALLNREVRIRSVTLLPPYALRIQNLSIEDLLTVDSITLEPSIAGLFVSPGSLNKLLIVKPELIVVRNQDASFGFDSLVISLQEKLAAPQRDKRKPFFIKDAFVKEGSILFKDQVSGASFSLKPLDCSIRTSLRDFKTQIDVKAFLSLENGVSAGEISMNGWLNMLKKDMKAKAVIEIKDVSFLAFYFKSLLSNINAGSAALRADFDAQHNDLTIDCHLEAKNIEFNSTAVSDEITSAEGMAMAVFLSMLTQGGGNLDFSIHTKFDNPRFEGLQGLKVRTFQTVPQTILSVIPQDKESAKKMKQDFKAIGKQFEKQFKDVKKQFEEFEKSDIGG